MQSRTNDHRYARQNLLTFHAEKDNLESMVNAFIFFILLVLILAVSFTLGYKTGEGEAATQYAERCRIIRRHALDNNESEKLTRAAVLIADFIEQVKTPGFHGDAGAVRPRH